MLESEITLNSSVQCSLAHLIAVTQALKELWPVGLLAYKSLARTFLCSALLKSAMNNIFHQGLLMPHTLEVTVTQFSVYPQLECLMQNS